MTQEEKTRAYEDALERAKESLNDGTISQNVIDYLYDIFPELKESEKIRKELLEHCKNQAEPYILTGNKCPQIQSWIDWLEKQKKEEYICVNAKGVVPKKEATGVLKELCEDEKIREELLSIARRCLETRGTLFGKTYDWQKWIDWLERQKLIN